MGRAPSRRSSAIVIALAVLATACQGLTQWEPAEGPPARDPNLGQDPLVTIDDDTVTDQNDTVGGCVWTMIWAKTTSGPDWREYAIDLDLLDIEGENSDGEMLVCDGISFDGPRNYQIPLNDLDPGWYSACTNSCTEPFQVP